LTSRTLTTNVYVVGATLLAHMLVIALSENELRNGCY